ncbi:metabolite/H+ symporter [Massilia terrae]|uniref:MHS family MFS transporter n=1 Tax=Massilia terrae TaxID=1811224 RepID=A0ABT2CWM1_9BURK|nr:MFS transporter [Massilia terrae]MCS0657503.1 MHS family MFS transporter [Massilia terrae]
MTAAVAARPVNRPATVLFASLAGTTIEFFDFYTYANAAVLVFPKLFFPAADPTAASMQSLVTFAIAFLARPFGSAIFGHFGDRIGRKATLVAALLTMGISTVVIGLLPTYADIGMAAPLLLALCRFGQGLGLGGEWGGAVLLATENAPPSRRAWYGMFPQLGAPIGFFLSSGVFLLLSATLTDAEFFAWGWRVPFLASALLVLVGLYVRLTLTETPAFQAVLDKKELERVPALAVLRDHRRALVLGTFLAVATFVLFYLMTVFTMVWGTGPLHFSRKQLLLLQLVSVVFFGLTIPLSAVIADRRGARAAMILVSVLIIVFGLFMKPLFGSGHMALMTVFMVLGLSLTGLTYGPLGTLLSELFPAEVRYTGSSLSFNLAGIIGASLAPYVALWLAKNYGVQYVGYYLSSSALLSLVALLLTARPRIGAATLSREHA